MFRSAYFPPDSTNITTVFVNAPKYDFRNSKVFFVNSVENHKLKHESTQQGAAISGPCPTNGTLPQNQWPPVSHVSSAALKIFEDVVV